MYTSLFISPNASYTADYDRKSMTLYKNDRKIYRWDYNFQDINICGISNTGKITSVADDKLYIFEKEGNIIGPIAEMSSNSSYNKYFIKNNLKADDKGLYICYEKVTDKTNPNKVHMYSEIIMYNVSTGNSQVWWNFTKDNKQNLDIDWAISKGFHYITFLERFYNPSQKDFYKLHLLDVFDDTQIHTMQINEIYAPNIMVNGRGEILLHCHSEHINRLLIFNPRGEKYEVVLPKSFYLFSMGRQVFMLKHEIYNQFIFMDTKNYTQHSFDLSVMDRHKIDYDIFIKDDDELALLYKLPHEGSYKRIEAPLADFLIHLKRWKLILEKQENQRKIPRIEKTDIEATYDQEKVQKLAESAMRQLNTKKEKIINKFNQISHLLEKLNSQFLYQELPENQYKENRSKLMDSIEKLALVAKKLKIEIDPEDIPKNLSDINILKNEIKKLADEGKIIPEIAKKWQEKIRLIEIKEKEQVKGKQKENPEGKEDASKVNWLLDLLDERLIKGEISEVIYLELREKYEEKKNFIKGKK